MSNVHCTVCNSDNTDIVLESSHLYRTRGFQIHNGMVCSDAAYFEPFYYCSSCGIVFRPEESCCNDIDDAHNRGGRLQKEILDSFLSHTKELFSDEYFSRWQWVLDHIEFEKVLDVGCSYGHFLWYMKCAGKDVNGIDPNEDAVKIGIKNLSVKIDTGYYGIESYGHKSFDLISSESCAYYLRPSIKTFFDIARTHLKRPGYIFLMVPGLDRTGLNFFSNVARVIVPFENIESIAASCGFEVVAKTKSWARLGGINFILRIIDESQITDRFLVKPEVLPLGVVRRKLKLAEYQFCQHVSGGYDGSLGSLLCFMDRIGIPASVVSLYSRVISRALMMLRGSEWR